MTATRTSEAASDRFFVDLLGCSRLREKRVDAELCGALFGVHREHRAVDYGAGETRFEVFLAPPGGPARDRLAHLCLEVEDVEGLAARCAAAGLEVRRARKGERSLVFVADEDGNLYEIQARPAAR